MFAYFDELVNGTHSGEYGIISHAYMAGHLRIIAHNAVISDDAVMSNVAIGHNETVVSNYCFPAIFCTPVNGNKFPDGGIVSDFYGGDFSFEFKILGTGRYNGARENSTVLTDPCTLHDGYIATYPRTFSYLHILMDDCKRIDLYVCGQLCIRVNICMWMDHVGEETVPCSGLVMV
jgi:hypothetical protein